VFNGSESTHTMDCERLREQWMKYVEGRQDTGSSEVTPLQSLYSL